jgi:hypothetical protein
MNSSEPKATSPRKASELYREGKYQEAFQEYLRAAEQGDVHAQAFLAWMYKAGCGTQKNEGESIKWYRVAADRGYPLAQELLGYFYYQKEDYATARDWYEMAASQNYLSAIWRLGRMHLNGKGTPVDVAKATALFEQAARQGHVFSKRDLALLLIKGRRGFRSVFSGIRLLLQSICELVPLALKDEANEKLRH